MDDRHLRVAFYSPSWPLGAQSNGVASYVDTITAALRRLGHSPCILSGRCSDVHPPPDVYPLEWIERSTLARISDRLISRIKPLTALRQRVSKALLQVARRAISERGIELLETEETFGLVQLIKPRLPIPVVVRLHGPHFVNGAAMGLPADAGFNGRVRHEGLGIAAADAVSSPSRDVLERTRAYYGLPLTKAVIIPNPAPAVSSEQRWSLTDCDRSRVLFVGRFDRHKGGDVVIDAFRILAGRFPGLRLWFAGPEDGMIDESGRIGTLANYLAERAPDVAERVDYLGRQPNSALPELRRRAFITVVGSRYENFPLVVLEAMAYGCPLAATRAGGIPEIVVDGVNGVLARPEDAGDLAHAVSRLLEAPEFAASLGRRAAEDAARLYDPDAIARHTVRFYRAVLENQN